MEKSLEKVIKKRIEPIVSEAMHKLLGVKIPELSEEISDKLRANPLLSYDIDTSVSFKTAKKLFKKEFISRMIQTHFGNVSDVAKKLRTDRRSIHRAIKELDINVEVIRSDLMSKAYFRRENVDKILRGTLDAYKTVLHPEKLENAYEHVSELSEDIVDKIPIAEMSLKDGEREFEILYLRKALEESNWNITNTSKKIKLRYETLIRKIKRLGLIRQ